MVATEEPEEGERYKKTKVKFDRDFPKIWVPSTMDGKGEPILVGAKGMGDPVICKKLMRTMIHPIDYDTTINMSSENL